MIKLLVSLLFILNTTGLLAQSSNSIPLDHKRLPADNLNYPKNHEFEGLSVEEVFERQRVSTSDLSLIDPIEDESWQDQKQSLEVNLDVDNSQLYNFSNSLETGNEIFRFNINGSENNKNYTVLLASNLHGILLRVNLLKKLGYRTPELKFVKELTVRFDDLDQKKKILDKISWNTERKATKWIKENSEDELEITFQDIAVTQIKWENPYDLSLEAPEGLTSNRAIRALSIPFSLANMKESANSLKWYEGLVVNKHIALSYNFSFNATVDDARWILRKIEKLTRSDFKEIAQKAYLPKAVEALVIEKLISRRNYLLKLFKVKMNKLEVERKISFGEELEDGKLIVKDWKGYASDFSKENQKSPFDQVSSYFLLRLQEIALGQITDLISDELVLDNTTAKVQEFRLKRLEELMASFDENGIPKNMPVGVWNSQRAGINLIAARNVTIGGQFANMSQVQLADTFGYVTSLGAFAGVEGIELQGVGSPLLVLGANLSFVHTFTHVRPVKSLRNALYNTSYKNIFVPLTKRKILKSLDKVLSLHGQDNPDEALLKEGLEELTSFLGKGESLVINKQLVKGINANFSFLLGPSGSSSIGASVNHINIKKLIISRTGENTIKLYDNTGRSWSFETSISYDYVVPVIKISLEKKIGNYNTKIHQLNISSNLDKNPEFFDNVKAFRDILKKASFKHLEYKKDPITLTGKFNDTTGRVGFLFFKAIQNKSKTSLTVKTPSGKVGEYLRFTTTYKRGVDYQDYFLSATEGILSEKTDYDLDLPGGDANNPENSWGGKSYKKIIMSEMAIKQNKVKSPLTRVLESWSGWQLSKKKLVKRLKKINKRYKHELFPLDTLHNLESIRLYKIMVRTNIYKEGLANLEELNRNRIAENGKKCGYRGMIYRCSRLLRLARKVKSCLKKKDDTEDYYKCLNKTVGFLQSKFNVEKFENILGEDNYYIEGLINGIRKGDELVTGEEKSHSLGKVRSRYWDGIWSQLATTLRISEFDLMGYWLREYLQ